MSKYKLSNSSLFGLGLVVSTGMVMPLTVFGRSSIAGVTTLGNLSESHLRKDQYQSRVIGE